MIISPIGMSVPILGPIGRRCRRYLVVFGAIGIGFDIVLLLIPNQVLIATDVCPHPQPFSPGRREPDSKSLAPRERDLGRRLISRAHCLIWYHLRFIAHILIGQAVLTTSVRDLRLSF